MNCVDKDAYIDTLIAKCDFLEKQLVRLRVRSNPQACHNCGRAGHLARDCERGRARHNYGRRCYNCQQFGHEARDCAVQSHMQDERLSTTVHSDRGSPPPVRYPSDRGASGQPLERYHSDRGSSPLERYSDHGTSGAPLARYLASDRGASPRGRYGDHGGFVQPLARHSHAPAHHRQCNNERFVQNDRHTVDMSNLEPRHSQECNDWRSNDKCNNERSREQRATPRRRRRAHRGQLQPKASSALILQSQNADHHNIRACGAPIEHRTEREEARATDRRQAAPQRLQCNEQRATSWRRRKKKPQPPTQ